MTVVEFQNPRGGILQAAIAIALLALTAGGAAAQEELPTDRLLRSLQATADVNDFAGVLSPAERDALEARCRALREKMEAQLAVVTLKTLEGGQIDDFAVKLFQRWGIGQKDKRNGVLLLVAIQDRKARIEVGYGLEPILPDALAGRILNEQLFPAFRQKRYAEGLSAAVNRIVEIVERNEPAPAKLRQAGGRNDKLMAVIMLSLFVAAGSFGLGAGMAQRVGCLLAFSGLFVVIPFLVGLALAFPIAPIVHVPLGLLMGWAGWRAAQDNFGGRARPGSPGPWNWGTPGVGTWDWGSSLGNSGWSGGSFSGGGDSWGGFGGGSSGGGGASGGW